jgi:calnexin
VRRAPRAARARGRPGSAPPERVRSRARAPAPAARSRWSLEPHLHEAIEGDRGLVVTDAAKKHAVSTVFAEPFVPAEGGLVVQFELQLKNTLQCGGAYLKLLTASAELSADGFHAGTPYTLMFGPDKCGDTNKVHFILRHQSPKTGEWEEKHLVSPPTPNTVDKRTHLYTAVVGVDNSVRILVDNVEVKAASLTAEADFQPPINPPTEIDDPADAKPADWVDDPKMDEPGAAKPDDWDEDAPLQITDPKAAKPSGWLDDAPDMIPDESAVKPDDWDADEDGEWEAPLVPNPECKTHGCGEWVAPMISNPAYKGKWSVPKVDNPAYIGVWAPKKIANPNYFEDDKPYAMAPIGGIGIELWTMQDGILFDNILVARDPAVASALAAQTYVPRAAEEKVKTKVAGAAGLEREEGVTGTIKYFFFHAVYFVQDHPFAVGAVVCLVFLPLLFLCCCMGEPKSYKDDEDDEPPAAAAPKPASKAKAKAKAGKSKDSDDDDSDDDVDEDDAKARIEEIVPDPKPKGGAKKRTPKAS